MSINLGHLREGGCGCNNDVEIINENHGRQIVVNAPSHERILERETIEGSGCGSGLQDTVIKGRPEIVMHRQPTLIVKRPPTTVRINHAPMIVKSSPIVFHRGGDRIHRPIIKKHLKRPVHIRPVVVKVVRPIEKKVLVEKHEAPCNEEEEVVLRGGNHHGWNDNGVRVLENLGQYGRGETIVENEETIDENCGCNQGLIREDIIERGYGGHSHGNLW